ncbi:MAG: hypothetical protein JO235_28400 [Chroococcidiopsidaceae cyanobacterium CP_BM_RX_35]|nr:hypothetical protein [Chroococcidiopsidaceae cyanobacterium CP_BM_RX_35]
MYSQLGKMKWQQGILYLKPLRQPRFDPFYDFPDIVGNAEVEYISNMLKVDENIEQSTGQKQRSIKLSTGIGTYFKLLKKGWQVVGTGLLKGG